MARSRSSVDRCGQGRQQHLRVLDLAGAFHGRFDQCVRLLVSAPVGEYRDQQVASHRHDLGPASGQVVFDDLRELGLGFVPPSQPDEALHSRGSGEVERRLLSTHFEELDGRLDHGECRRRSFHHLEGRVEVVGRVDVRHVAEVHPDAV